MTTGSAAVDHEVSYYVPIEKVDPEQRMVWGYASTPDLDSQGERVSVKALEAALPDYMRFGNIREMHRPSAVGKTKAAKVDDKGMYIGAKVVDAAAWEKVKEGVYSGFSIGGRVTEKVDDEIRGLQLNEISLVDRPANPGAVFDVWKCDAPTPDKGDGDKEVEKSEETHEKQEERKRETRPVKDAGRLQWLHEPGRLTLKMEEVPNG